MGTFGKTSYVPVFCNKIFEDKINYRMNNPLDFLAISCFQCNTVSFQKTVPESLQLRHKKLEPSQTLPL